MQPGAGPPDTGTDKGPSLHKHRASFLVQAPRPGRCQGDGRRRMALARQPPAGNMDLTGPAIDHGIMHGGSGRAARGRFGINHAGFERMVLAIRDVGESDLAAVLALNNTANGSVSPLDTAQLSHLYATADYFRVAEVNGALAGFLIALRAGRDHHTPGFLWFSERQQHFLYIDRVAVANTHRRHGLGRIFYADVQSFAEPRVPLLGCAVVLEPRDDVSVLFHGTYGFTEVGQRATPDGHRIGLLSKELACHAFIARHYGSEENLPDVPWLAGRLPLSRNAPQATPPTEHHHA